MPHLVQMDKKLSKKGLVIVAPEVQRSSVEDIKEVLEENDAEYTVTKGITGPSLSNGIPSTAVFDVSGKLIYVGHPADPETEKVLGDDEADTMLNRPEYREPYVVPQEV